MYQSQTIIYEQIGEPSDTETRYRILIKNLDRFLIQIYNYYLRKGYYCIMLENIINLLMMSFLILISVTLISFTNYNIMFTSYDLNKAIDISFKNISTSVLIYVFLCTIFILKQIVLIFNEGVSFYKIRRFYIDQLNITDLEIETIDWYNIVKRLCDLQNLHYNNEGITPLEIVNRIMRRENYLIALINKNIINLNFDLPILGMYPFLTKTIEWSINLTVIDFMFSEQNNLKIEFLRADLQKKLELSLKYRFVFVGILSLILSPFILLLLVMYYLFKYGEEYKNQNNVISSRQWSLLAKWQFREYNELSDIFQKRLNKGHKYAIEYVNQFPSYKLSHIFRLVEFVAGAFICILVIFTIYDDDVLIKLHIIENKSALWFLGILGGIITICRAYRPDENFIFEPIKTMNNVVKYTHYMPENWKNKCHTEYVACIFKRLFDYKIVLFINEILGVIIVPFILLFYFPNLSGNIIEFVKNFTTDVSGIGHICSFAAFDINHNGDLIYETNINENENENENEEENQSQLIDSKMEDSYINFTEKYLKNDNQENTIETGIIDDGNSYIRMDEF
jgi:autophagy-related protein 9